MILLSAIKHLDSKLLISKPCQILFLGILLSCVFLPSPAVAATTCDFEKLPVSFTFKELRAEVTLNHTKNNKELEQLALGISEGYVKTIQNRLDKSRTRGEHFSVGGFAHGPFVLHTRLNFHQRKMPDNSICMQVTGVYLQAGFKEMLVYVSSEFEKNTCRFKAVLIHELQHVKIHNAALSRAIPGFKEMETFVNDLPPRNGQDVNQIKLQFKEDFLNGLQRVVDGFKLYGYRENAKLDTIENYRYELTLCPSPTTIPNLVYENDPELKPEPGSSPAKSENQWQFLNEGR